MPAAPPVFSPLGAPREAARIRDQWRGAAASRGYDRAWQRFRRAMLAERPICEDCAATGRPVEAREVHHVFKLKDHPDRRLDPAAVRCLCKACHSRRTALGE